MPGATPLRPLIDALERTAALDAAGKAVGKLVRDRVPRGPVKDALSGTWLGHAVHPPLTDVVIGSFLGASLLDLLRSDDGAARRLIGVGIVAAVPTAATGANDWADTEIADARVRRVGLAHASANVTALTLYAASFAARRAGGSHARGAMLAAAGAAVLTAGGYLGGHMSYVRGVGPNQTAFDPGPEDWTVAMGSDDLADGEPRTAVVADTPVLLLRHADGIHAIHDRCSHRGCSLAGGEVDGHVVTCACHGSAFDVRDGALRRGPATSEQPSFEARERDGRVEVRLGAGD